MVLELYKVVHTGHKELTLAIMIYLFFPKLSLIFLKYHELPWTILIEPDFELFFKNVHLK